MYAESDAYDSLYSVLKEYGYKSGEYKRAAQYCKEVKEEYGSSKPDIDGAMKNRAIKEYAPYRQRGNYKRAEPLRQRCIEIFGSASEVDAAYKNWEKKEQTKKENKRKKINS